jgi:hypothetical protein
MLGCCGRRRKARPKGPPDGALDGERWQLFGLLLTGKVVG